MSQLRRSALWSMAVLMSAIVGVLSDAQAEVGKKQPEILMLLWSRETEYEEYFKERLKNIGLTPNYTTILGGQSRTELSAQLRRLEAEIAAGKFDLVYSWGTTTTEIGKGLIKGRVPILFNVVFDPVGAGLVESMEAPGGSITGVTNGVPVEQQLDAFSQLSKFGTLCFFFNGREQNAVQALKKVTLWGQSNSVVIHQIRTAPDTPLLDEAVQKVVGGQLKCDGIYAAADAYLGSRARDMRQALGSKVKLFGGTARFVQQGWLAALAPEVSDMGASAADIAAKLVSGQKPADIPVILPTPKLIISAPGAAVHGISVPPGARSIQPDQ